MNIKEPVFRLKQILAICIAPFIVLTSQQAMAETEAKVLEEIVVTASALKVDTPTKETPKSISIITEEGLIQRAVQKLDESLRYTSGITVQPYGSDNDTDWFKIRGFDATTYLNGNRLFRDGYYTWLIEPYGLEKIEVVKGPSSLLFGEASPGGVVNVVQKKPLDSPFGEVRLQGGSKNLRAISLDISNFANEDETVGYRLVGLAKYNEGELEDTENTRYYLAPSVSIKFSERTNLTLNLTGLQDDGVPTNPFFPAAGTLLDTPHGKISPSTNLGEPDYDKYERTQISAGYLLEHKLGRVWTLSQNFNYGLNKLYLRSSYAFPNSDPDATELFRGIVFREGDLKSYTLDNKAIAKWGGSDMEHTVLMGIDIQQHKNTGDEQDNFAFGTINPYNPQYGNFTPLNSDNNIDREISKFQTSIYTQYQLKLVSKWIGVIGGRHDRVETKNMSKKGNQDESREDGEVSLNSGLMYLADNGLSPYVNYSQSFEVLSTIDPATGKLYDPLDGEQREIGVKYTPDSVNGYVTLAFFDIIQKNALVTNPDTFVATQTGEVTSQGVELEGAFQVADPLKLSAGYTYTDAQTDNTGGKGTKQAALIPKHMASLWGDFDVSRTGSSGWKIGTGVRHIGESKDNPASSDRTVPSVNLLDAMVSYDFNANWKAQLNANNIVNEEYISGCDYYCYYGQSRSFVADLSYYW